MDITTKKKIILMVSVAAIIILVAMVIDVYAMPFNEFENDVEITVKNESIGFDTTHSCFDFGKNHSVIHLGRLNPGNSGGRSILLTNGMNEANVVITSEGEISKWLIISDTNFRLAPSEEKKIELSVDVPKEADLGNYTGNLHIKFYKVLF